MFYAHHDTIPAATTLASQPSTDAMTVAMIDDYDVDLVLSFDDDFDGIVDRLAPEAAIE